MCTLMPYPVVLISGGFDTYSQAGSSILVLVVLICIYFRLTHSFLFHIYVHAEILCFTQLVLYPVHAIVLISVGIDIYSQAGSSIPLLVCSICSYLIELFYIYLSLACCDIVVHCSAFF